MKRNDRRTAPTVSKKAPARTGPAGTKGARRADLPLRDLATKAGREDVRAANRRVTPSRQSNRRPQRSK